MDREVCTFYSTLDRGSILNSFLREEWRSKIVLSMASTLLKLMLEIAQVTLKNG